LKLKSIRRIAAKILNTGISKVWIDSSQAAKAREAITAEDVRELVKKGIVKKKRPSFQSKGRARVLKAQKRKGRKKGFGKRKGKAKARMRKKETWTKRVRALRRKWKELKKQESLEGKEFSKAYRLIKGNYFKGRKQLEEFIKTGK